MDIAQQRLPGTSLAAVCCSEWHCVYLRSAVAAGISPWSSVVQSAALCLVACDLPGSQSRLQHRCCSQHPGLSLCPRSREAAGRWRVHASRGWSGGAAQRRLLRGSCAVLRQRSARGEAIVDMVFEFRVFCTYIFSQDGPQHPLPRWAPSCQDGPHLAKMGPIRGPSSERCSSKFIVSARRTCGIPPRPTLSYLGILPLLYPSRKEGETRNGKDRGTRGTRKRLRPASGR